MRVKIDSGGIYDYERNRVIKRNSRYFKKHQEGWHVIIVGCCCIDKIDDDDDERKSC